MNPREVELLAEAVTEEWAAERGDRSDPAVAVAGVQEQTAGAYWPLGSSTPTGAPPMIRDRIRFLAAGAVGTCLVFGFTLDDIPRQYLVCLDLTGAAGADLRVVTGWVFESVTKVARSAGNAEEHTAVLEVSPDVTIVVP